MELYKISNLGKRYHAQEGTDKNVLDKISFSIESSEFLAIMGRSGCGKSTLLRILGLVDQASDGEIQFEGESVKDLKRDKLADIRRNRIGFVFQDFQLMNSLTVEENIMLPRILNKEKIKQARIAAKEYAQQFGISQLLDKNPYNLSGGERQRVAICRALINQPEIIFADEPTGNLDSKSGGMVIDTLREVNEKLHKTIVLVTHDPQVASHCKRVLFLKDGRIMNEAVREAGQEEFYREILKQIERI